MKKLLFTGLMSISLVSIASNGNKQSEPLDYWGKSISGLSAQDPELKTALSQACWDTRYIRFFSLFTSQFSQERIERMQKCMNIINNTIERINERINCYYNRGSASSDCNNMATAVILGTASLLFSIFDNSASRNRKSIAVMDASKKYLCSVRDSLIKALKICKVEIEQ